MFIRDINLQGFFFFFQFLVPSAVLETALSTGMGDPWPRNEKMAGPRYLKVGRELQRV